MTTNTPLRWETHGWNNYLQRHWKRPRSEHVESNVEMSGYLTAAKERRYANLEEHGCCCEWTDSECVISTFDPATKTETEIERRACHNCRAFGKCRLDQQIEVIDAWCEKFMQWVESLPTGAINARAL